MEEGTLTKVTKVIIHMLAGWALFNIAVAVRFIDPLAPLEVQSTEQARAEALDNEAFKAASKAIRNTK